MRVLTASSVVGSYQLFQNSSACATVSITHQWRNLAEMPYGQLKGHKKRMSIPRRVSSRLESVLLASSYDFCYLHDAALNIC